MNKSNGAIGIMAYQILTDIKIETNLANGCKKTTYSTNEESIQKIVKINPIQRLDAGLMFLNFNNGFVGFSSI